MRKILASWLLLIAAGVAACDDSTGPTAKRLADTCPARRITIPPYRAGACVHDGQRYVVANGTSPLHLKTLTATPRYFTVIDQIAGRTPRHGIFMLIRLRVKNTTSAPQRFLPGQTSLQFRTRQLEEQAAVERLDKDALSALGRTIAPGEAIEGVVVYDVAPRTVTAVMRAGLLYVAGFGPKASRSVLGVFRLGATSRRAVIRGRR